MLILKLLTVPVFIMLITLSARRWGPQAAGVMAGFPLIAGPILLFIALEQGHRFAAAAATATVSAVTAAVAFGVAYAWSSRFLAWWWSLPAALAVWAGAALALAQLQPSLAIATAMSLGMLWLAPRLLPSVANVDTAKPVSNGELLVRMLAGALLVAAVTSAAASVGSRWSGLMAMFPVLASVLSVFSHRSYGPAYVARLLRGMVTGYYSFTAFCVTLAVLLPEAGTVTAFATALAGAFVLQVGMQGIQRLIESQAVNAAREAA